MSLKPKKSQIFSASPSAKPDKLTGPWGRINPESSSVAVVRFCQGTSTATEKTHSYPYRVISSWHWTNGTTEEELKIEASDDLITVKGLRLDRIVEALDRGILEILRDIPGDAPSEEGRAIWVSTINIAGKLND